MRRGILICIMITFLAAPAGAANTTKLPPEVLKAAAEVGYHLPDAIPTDILQRATAAYPEPAAVKAMAPWPTTGWAESTPEDQGMSTALLTDAFRYAFSRSAKGVVVIRNGYLVGEHYGPAWDASTRQQAFSVSKSFTSSLLGMLMDDGVITGPDQAAADFIPEWNDPQHGAVTVGHLLSMDSGLEYNLLTDPLLLISRDQSAYAVGLPMQHVPATKWVYHNAACQVPSRIILEATGMQPGEFAAGRLAGVIGMPTATWDTDRAGNTLTYMGVVASPRELAKFGYLFLRQGQWDGRQVVSADYVQSATRPSQSLNPFYGYLWWLNTAGLAMPDVPADAYAALGFEEKRIYVVPSLDLVAVRLGDPDGAWDDNAFLGRVCAAVTGSVATPKAAEHPLAERDEAARPVLLAADPAPQAGGPRIAFSLSAEARVSLVVYDLRGRRVRTLLDGRAMGGGEHGIAWDGRSSGGVRAATGVYLYRLAAGAEVITGRLVLLD